MKHIALMVMLGIMTLLIGACSENLSPTAPQNAAAIVFPVDVGDDLDPELKPAIPTELHGNIGGSKVKLSWRHADVAPGWYRIYVSRDYGPFEMIRSTDCRFCVACIGCDWSVLEYRVTAVNKLGLESDYSDPIIFKRKYSEPPNIDVYDDDGWN